jgi:hypothetical protein
MDQASILILGFMGPLIVIGIIGIIYWFYDNKRRAKQHGD